jgi:hypothetical protein
MAPLSWLSIISSHYRTCQYASRICSLSTSGIMALTSRRPEVTLFTAKARMPGGHRWMSPTRLLRSCGTSSDTSKDGFSVSQADPREAVYAVTGAGWVHDERVEICQSKGEWGSCPRYAQMTQCGHRLQSAPGSSKGTAPLFKTGAGTAERRIGDRAFGLQLLRDKKVQASVRDDACKFAKPQRGAPRGWHRKQKGQVPTVRMTTIGHKRRR